MIFPARSSVWFSYVFRIIHAGNRGKWLKCFLCMFPVAAATHLLQCLAVYQTWHYSAHGHSNATALQCIQSCVLYTMKWSSCSSGDSSVSEGTLDLSLRAFDFTICPVLPYRKHLPNLNLHARGESLLTQRQHCCLDACWLCFPKILTCLGYLSSLCFGATLTQLTFSLEDAPTLAPPGEWNYINRTLPDKCPFPLHFGISNLVWFAHMLRQPNVITQKYHL